MKNSTNRRLTMSELIASIHISDGAVPLGEQFAGYNNEYNHNFFKAFRYSQSKNSYGPVLPASWRGRQLIAGGVF